MDVVDLDKVLDDFEFNEEKSDPSKCILHKEPQQIKNNITLTNNNEIDLTPSGTTENNTAIPSTINADCSNDTNQFVPNNPAQKNVATPYPTKNNVNVANVFTSLIEYINAGNEQLAQSVPIVSLVDSEADLNESRTNDSAQVKPVIQITSALDKIHLDSDQYSEPENKIVASTFLTELEKNGELVETQIDNQNNGDVKNNYKEKDTLPSTISVDSETDDDISDQDLSGSMQTSLSYTADNQGLKVIGFNSTMDDISDAELESYLQQIEIEHSNMELLESPELETQTDANPIKCYITNEAGIVAYVENTNSDDGLYIADTENIGNYDSISQASTVEINDTQTSSDNVIEQSLEKRIESPTKLAIIETNDSDLCSSSNTDQSVIDPPESHTIAHPNTLNISPFTLDFQVSSAGQTPMNSKQSFEDYKESPTSSEQDSEFGDYKPIDDQISNGENSVPISGDCLFSTSATLASNNSNDNESKDLQLPPESHQEPVPLNLLGKIAPYWIPDHVSSICMQCGLKFTVIKRRHHCRACGQVLCSRCCCMKAKLNYLGNAESRVCLVCFELLTNICDVMDSSPGAVGGPSRNSDRPNPNNPMEYCSVIPPLQQVSNSAPNPISVMVPIGVLKREGSQKSRTEKTVMFSDGIRPGSDLTKLDHSWDTTETSTTHTNSPQKEDPEDHEVKKET